MDKKYQLALGVAWLVFCFGAGVGLALVVIAHEEANAPALSERTVAQSSLPATPRRQETQEEKKAIPRTVEKTSPHAEKNAEAEPPSSPTGGRRPNTVRDVEKNQKPAAPKTAPPAERRRERVPDPAERRAEQSERKPEEWSHSELLAHFRKHGLKLVTGNTNRGSLRGPAMYFGREGADVNHFILDSILDTLGVNAEGFQGFAYVQKRKSSEEAHDAAGVLGDNAFSWHKFLFAGDPSFLAELRKALTE